MRLGDNILGYFFFLYRLLLEAGKNQHTYQNSLLRFEIHIHEELFSNKHTDQGNPFRLGIAIVSKYKTYIRGSDEFKKVLIKFLVFAKMSGVFFSV